MTLAFDQSCISNQQFQCPIFSEILQLFWMKFTVLPQPVGLLKLMLNLFCTSNMQGRERCWRYQVKYLINIVLRLDTCEPISFHTWCVARDD